MGLQCVIQDHSAALWAFVKTDRQTDSILRFTCVHFPEAFSCVVCFVWWDIYPTSHAELLCLRHWFCRLSNFALLSVFPLVSLRPAHEADIFRSNSPVTKMLQLYSGTVGRSYLKGLLKPLITRLSNSSKQYEVSRFFSIIMSSTVLYSYSIVSSAQFSVDWVRVKWHVLHSHMMRCLLASSYASLYCCAFLAGRLPHSNDSSSYHSLSVTYICLCAWMFVCRVYQMDPMRIRDQLQATKNHRNLEKVSTSH